ncbi:MAG: NUDIX domain-containing protein [Chitinispirillia bacterium]|nr:NUDIX domain-containing protein [Chitinispirillia bacterium]
MDDLNSLPIVEQAGAVMYRCDDNGEIQILTVHPKKDPTARIFPKGHIEEGESDIEAAARECLEEAGMSGTIIGYAGEREFTHKNKRCRVKYHLMRYVSKENDGEPGRNPQWNSVSKTNELLPYESLKQILDNCVRLIADGADT